MTLTSKPGKKNKIHLFLDGEYVATTTADFWFSCNYKDGIDISNDDWNEFLFEIQEKKIYGRALDLLEMRDHSRRELSDKLYKKLSPDVTDKSALKQQIINVCDKLEAMTLLNDERFARLYAEESCRNKHLSPRGLRAALIAKGISKDIVEMVIEETDINPKEEIIHLLSTKFKNRDLLVEGEQNRTFNALLRLGYSYGEIKSAIYEYTGNLTEDTADNF